MRWVLHLSSPSQSLEQVLLVFLLLPIEGCDVHATTGAATAAALASEKYFDVIRVFERRETPGGTWYAYPTSRFTIAKYHYSPILPTTS